MSTTEETREGFYLGEDGEWIPDGWKPRSLSSLTSKIGSGATPRGGKEAYKKEGISLIRSQNILDLKFEPNGLAFIDQTQAGQLSNVEIEEDDVLINITGDSVARICKVPSEFLPARVNQHVAIIRANESESSPAFLEYLLVARQNKGDLLGLASAGATRNALTKSMLENFTRVVPPLPEQKAIAAVLGSLDDKIELLREQNETLEALAQTLFKRWFIDFNFPDENGNPYKDSGGKMIPSELGEIPEVWRVFNLGYFFELKSGNAFKGAEFVENSVNKVIKIKDLKGGGVIDSSTLSMVTDEAVQTNRAKLFKLKPADILVAMSGNTTGKIGVFSDCEQEIYLNQRVGKFFHKSRLSNGFLYAFLFSGGYEKKILDMGYGSAQPNINPKQISEIQLTLPENISYLESKFDNIIVKVVSNTQQIQTLTSLRDTLLPKLMKGEIRIK